MQEISNVVVCEYCDTMHRKMVLKAGQAAYCQCCNAKLHIVSNKLSKYLLPLTLAALVMFVIANSFPILEMQVQGKTSTVTLIGSLILLKQDGAPLVSGLILLTTMLSPLLHIGIIMYVIYAYQTQKTLPGMHLLIRLLQVLLPWGMVEVFMLGILVAVIKLSSVATIIPGVALWAFVALSILMTLIITFDVKTLWHVGDLTD
ncbi:MAG: paraquat-inducible protein A [Methylophilus sp.]|jgi:paraquat-inducible protein A